MFAKARFTKLGSVWDVICGRYHIMKSSQICTLATKGQGLLYVIVIHRKKAGINVVCCGPMWAFDFSLLGELGKLKQIV